MKILVGCEESQAVTIELRKLGFEAYSCDLQVRRKIAIRCCYTFGF